MHSDDAPSLNIHIMYILTLHTHPPIVVASPLTTVRMMIFLVKIILKNFPHLLLFNGPTNSHRHYHRIDLERIESKRFDHNVYN